MEREGGSGSEEGSAEGGGGGGGSGREGAETKSSIGQEGKDVLRDLIWRTHEARKSREAILSMTKDASRCRIRLRRLRSEE